LSRDADIILISIPAFSFSQIRGTAKNSVGCTSRRFACTVSMDSAKCTSTPALGVAPRRDGPLGDVAQRQVRQDDVVGRRPAGW
jgi:hypothetical protein